MPDILCPGPGLVGPPFTETEDDRPACFVQRVTHKCIRSGGIHRPRIAPVLFEVIHAPGSILPRILPFIALTRGPPPTGIPPGTGIDTELQALRMDIIRQRLDPMREFHRINLDIPGAVAADLPAVIDD